MIREKKTMAPSGIVIDLTGPDGNAFCLIGCARSWARQCGMDVDAITAELTSGDYEHLLSVLEKYFGSVVTFLR